MAAPALQGTSFHAFFYPPRMTADASFMIRIHKCFLVFCFPPEWSIKYKVSFFVPRMTCLTAILFICFSVQAVIEQDLRPFKFTENFRMPYNEHTMFIIVFSSCLLSGIDFICYIHKEQHDQTYKENNHNRTFFSAHACLSFHEARNASGICIVLTSNSFAKSTCMSSL